MLYAQICRDLLRNKCPPAGIFRHIEDELSEFMIRQKENVPERIEFIMNGDEVVLMAAPKPDLDLIAN